MSKAYRVSYEKRFIKDLKKIGHVSAGRITRYLEERIDGTDDPRQFGEALRRDLDGLWRYEVADCRVIVDIQDDELLVLAVHAGNRKNVYD